MMNRKGELETKRAFFRKTHPFDRIMATDYGRNPFEIVFDVPTVTEIKAHAKGNNRREIARGVHPSVIRRAAGMINRVSPEGGYRFHRRCG